MAGWNLTSKKAIFADSFTNIQSNIQGLEACRIFPNKNA
jgi:hypothetical protein